jgi:hypothetical protein
MRLVLAVALTSAGCALFDPRPVEPPARLTIGAATRRFAAPVDNDSATFRQSPPPAPELTVPHESVLATVGFTMASKYGTYAGGEIETGVLDSPGSSAAGMYGVFGVRRAIEAGYFAAELASGWRSVRYSLDTEPVGKLVAEPRLRADVWLGPQFTLGATLGLTLGDQTVWMAGVSLGVHSHELNRR